MKQYDTIISDVLQSLQPVGKGSYRWNFSLQQGYGIGISTSFIELQFSLPGANGYVLTSIHARTWIPDQQVPLRSRGSIQVTALTDPIIPLLPLTVIAGSNVSPNHGLYFDGNMLQPAIFDPGILLNSNQIYSIAMEAIFEPATIGGNALFQASLVFRDP